MSRYKALISKAGLDAHERGVHVVARGLRDSGFETVVLGLRTTPEILVASAIQEDVDVIGISSLAGSHMHFVKKVTELLREEDFDPVLVVGGVIPDEDLVPLEALGVDAIFRSGSLVLNMAEVIRGLCDEKASAASVKNKEISK
ncbi:cobalamin-dependent protein [Rhodococcus artemisiae]|uniref:Cobalamin-dependent protein n=1 Tax=Rhodococcus artemisiae TaxID=714159 RepID=A0ABU7LBT4_9NOCA|nr:cobalamin-dependent protein [Rhodococcus artemisiae]MEE2059010.1 cobalamin-dependent protein [Rhodococcus artemisiae]